MSKTLQRRLCNVDIVVCSHREQSTNMKTDHTIFNSTRTQTQKGEFLFSVLFHGLFY